MIARLSILLMAAFLTNAFVPAVCAQETAASTPVADDTVAPSAWTDEQTRRILDKTLTLHLAPELSHLDLAEQECVKNLIAAGKVLHELYLQQRHPDAKQCWEQLVDSLASAEELPERLRHQQTMRLFWLFKGPVATTLDNRRLPFIGDTNETPGKNVYPADVDKAAMSKQLADGNVTGMPLLGLRTVVRRYSAKVESDVATLRRHPLLQRLYPGLLTALGEGTRPESGYYAIPYAVAYADELMEVYDHLFAAALPLQEQDPEFSRYLRHRARDLLAGDYEAGDASWVTGKFGKLNAQIGSYETYDDALFNVKAFYSLSVLARDIERSEELASAIADIQTIEDRLPYSVHKRVRQDIPVGVYNVIADFGQSRGTNTATILPNEAEHARKYGRTILLRYNIMTHPGLFELARSRFRAAVVPDSHSHLTMDASFQRTLWHEVGHYLGVDQTADGRPLGAALEQYSDLYEELKADLVSLFAAQQLQELGHHSADELRSIYAAGILRVLQVVKPRPEQPYQTMQLMQWNYFLQQGVLQFDPQTGRLSIDYAAYPAAVSAMLKQVLEIQRAGNVKDAADFVAQYTVWDDALHEQIANRLQDAVPYRYRLVTYDALEIPWQEPNVAHE